MIQYDTYNAYLERAYTITEFFRYVSRMPEPKRGPCPALIARIENQIVLWENQRMTIHFGQNPPVVIRATPLYSCASVIYYSNATGNIHIHHAMLGELNNDDVETAFDELGTDNANSLYVIFAHPKGNDNTYQESLNLLEERGIPGNQILEITNGPKMFGVNSLGHIGL